ncbi:group III truncated hemoglobin [Flammeovirgaceae bacterium SG7u.111]|nr:group III truncated hemoglobin [Flammeovirgaceae bacterium SG7u.132]WPO37770.1 group III truncated hemoglobin [Flammeovirgaceae bacterium SG7u.111]
MRTLETREDIQFLVDKFYKQATADEAIGHFFTEVVQLDMEKHMPVMYDFWETTLLGNMVYKGNPMLKHFDLNKKSAIQPTHFAQWLSLWVSTVKQYFEGEKAEEAIKRASQIAGLMEFKIGQVNG